ncbi:MAG: beta-ketoacyl-ACP synthase III [Candidatus Eisenbacteria bacterium]
MNTAHRKQPSGIGIIGIGSYVPEGELTNLDLEKIVNTTDEWIVERTGIRKRHKADAQTATSDLAAGAALRALEDAGLKPDDIDVIIVGTATPDMFFPSTGCLVQKEIGARRAAAFDVSAACSGFLYGLSIAQDFVTTGKYNKVLVIGAETLTKIVDWTDRTTCVLFGDGAGAAVVGRVGDGRGIVSSLLASDGTMGDLLKLPAGGSRMPPTVETIKGGHHYVKMQGNKLFKAAVKAMASAAVEVLDDAGYSGDDLDLLVTHQANMRIIDATARRINIPPEKVFTNVDQYGNTSAASIPMALTEAKEKGVLKEGMLVELVSFGGGLTWASVLMRW